MSSAIDRFSETIGRYVAWLALGMVLVQFVIVGGRYVFGVGSAALQESVIYSHALLFLLGAAYTLLHDKHVRVDIFYAKAGMRIRAVINLLGNLFLLIPVCLGILLMSWGYVSGSWQIQEGSIENSGLPFIYALKSIILVFCGMMILQGVSSILRAILQLGGAEPDLSEHLGRD